MPELPGMTYFDKSLPQQQQLDQRSLSQKAAEVQVKKVKQEADRLETSSMDKQAAKTEAEDNLLELKNINKEGNEDKEVENQSTLGRGSRNVKKGFGQPLDDLNKKISEIFKTIKEMNERLTSFEHKQQEQGKFLWTLWERK